MSSRHLLPLALASSFLLAAGCATLQKTVSKPGEISPAPTPSPAETPEAKPTLTKTTPTGPITIAFTGDIMMGGSAASKLKTQGPDSFFTHTASFLKQADIAMGNLEGPLGTGGEKFPHKKYNFLVNPKAAEGLTYAGFKLLTLANNHTMDFGVEALQSTLKALDDQGLQHCGADLDESKARKPAWFRVRGHQVAVLAYSLTYPTEYWATDKRAGCAAASGPDMREDIGKARAQGADIVVVCCHWGQEKHTRLRGYQPDLAHLAIDSGADAVVCHHPHIWQQLEVYHGRPIAYAIGNFAFGTLTSIRDSGILFLTFDEKSLWTGGRIVPLDVNNFQVGFTPRPMSKKDAVRFYMYLKKLSKKKAGLKLVQGKTPEILWAAPEGEEEKWPAIAATPAPEKAALTPTPGAVATATPGPAGNPEGGVPGKVKP